MTNEYQSLRLPEGYSRERFVELAQEDPRYAGLSGQELGRFHDIRSPSFAQRLFNIRDQHLDTTKETFTYQDLQTTLDSAMTSVIQLVSASSDKIETKYELLDKHFSPELDSEGNSVYRCVSAPAELSVLDYWALVNT